MYNSSDSHLISDDLNKIITVYKMAKSTAEKDNIWQNIKTPLIENIANDENHHWVTFLYRLGSQYPNKLPSIYLYSAIAGLPIREQNLLKLIPNTDIYYLTLKLPSSLITTYNFLIVDETVNINAVSHIDDTHTAPFVITGEFKKNQDLLGQLFEKGKVEIDKNNINKIVFYIDFEIQDKYFAMESVLELPRAPKQLYLPNSLQLNNEHRKQLKSEKRFIECSINFAETSLKNVEGYIDIAEAKDNPPRATRKYWIYLPKDYQHESSKTYPLLLFLDASDYISTIPTPYLLDNMIKEKIIPPTIAVFLEYSGDRRMLEYNCDDKFTHFLANDFMFILRNKNKLAITKDPKLTTIVGLSASGLAVFYAGLTYHQVFGNVIAQSASFEMRKTNELEEMINNFIANIRDSQFSLEIGNYEDTPVELQYSDGTIQQLSSLQANRNVAEQLSKNGINVNLYELLGGHNYVRYRITLLDRIKELFDRRLNKTLRLSF